MPHQAAINAIPPSSSSGGNIFGLKIRIKAKPEFWIPVSIVIDLLSTAGSLNKLANEKPVVRATML